LTILGTNSFGIPPVQFCYNLLAISWMANFVASSTAVFRLHLLFAEFFSCFQCIFNLESTTILFQFIQALQLDPLLHAHAPRGRANRRPRADL
jgi:hypothetical protein